MAPVDQQFRRRAVRTGLTALEEGVNQVFRATHYLAQEIPTLG